MPNFENLKNYLILKSMLLEVQTFFVRIFDFKTDAALPSTLRNVGKHGTGKNIKVQSTSISRRKSKLGGMNRISPGRPLKKQDMNIEHQYAKKNEINHLQKKEKTTFFTVLSV